MSIYHEVTECCGYAYGGFDKKNLSIVPISEVTTKGHFSIISTHHEWKDEDRMHRWNVNEIECKHKKITWCSNDMLGELKRLKLI